MTGESRSDADLVGAWLAGESDAFAAIYDRYADDLYAFAMSRLRNRTEAADVVQETFARAASRLCQLRDRTRLRAWLYSVARNRVIDSTRRGADPYDNDHFSDLAADQPDAIDSVSRGEVAELVWVAAESLNERDREMLGLHLQHGLDGADLADVVGLSPAHVYVAMGRLKERMAKAVGALLIARHGSKDCDQLAAVLVGWDGTFSLDIRSKVTRHVESCAECTSRRTALISAASLSAGSLAVAVVAPAHLRTATLQQVALPAPMRDAVRARSRSHSRTTSRERWRSDGFPVPAGRANRAAILRVAAAIVALVGIAAGIIVATDDGDTQRLLTSPGTTEATSAAADVPKPTTPLTVSTTEPPLLVPTSATEPTDPSTTDAPSTTDDDGSATVAPVAHLGPESLGGVHVPSTSPPIASPDVQPPPSVTPAAPPPSTTKTTTAPTPSSSAAPPPTEPPSTSVVVTAAPPDTTATTTPPPTTAAPAPAPGSISVSTGSIDLGDRVTSRTMQLRNDGGQASAWSASTGLSGITLSPASGTLAPNEAVDVVVSVQRNGLAEATVTGSITVASAANGGGAVGVSYRVEHAPAVSAPKVSPAVLRPEPQCGAATTTVTAIVTDESGLTSVEVVWSADGSTTQRASMTAGGGGTYSRTVGPFSALGTRPITVQAVDTRGNVTSMATSVNVIACDIVG